MNVNIVVKINVTVGVKKTIMRGQYQNKLPKKLYYVDRGEQFLGPYAKKPTLLLKNSGTLIEYVLDSNENYIKQ